MGKELMKKGKTFLMTLGTGGLLGAGLFAGNSLLFVSGVVLGLYTLYKV